MAPSLSQAELDQLRLALHAYDHAAFGQLNTTADALRAAAIAAGYVFGAEPGLGPVAWSRRIVGAQLRAQGDGVRVTDSEFRDMLAALRAKGLMDLDAYGGPVLTEKGQAVVDRFKATIRRLEPAEGEPAR